MSEPPSRRVEEANELMAAQSLSLQILGRLNVDAGIADQIESLKKDIEEKNEAITKLSKHVERLQEQNDELTSVLESKDEEIKALKEKIVKLEKEKKDIETKLRSVEVELEAVRKEVDGLRDANKINEEKNVKMEENVKKLTVKMEGVKKSLEESRNENVSLKKDVKSLRELVQRRPPLGIPEKMALASASDRAVENATVILGELCRRLQAMMYKKVHPNSYDFKKSYKIKHITEDIEDLNDERQKLEARGRWEALKKKLNWTKTHTRAMKSIQESRNRAAHPEFNEELLVQSVALMKKEGKLIDWHNPDRVKELIEMWKTLKQA